MSKRVRTREASLRMYSQDMHSSMRKPPAHQGVYTSSLSVCIQANGQLPCFVFFPTFAKVSSQLQWRIQRGAPAARPPPPRLAAQPRQKINACTRWHLHYRDLQYGSATALSTQSHSTVWQGSGCIDGAAAALWYPNTCVWIYCMCRYFSKPEEAAYTRMSDSGHGGWGITCSDAVHAGCIIKQNYTSVPGLGSCTLRLNGPGNVFDKSFR